MSAPSFTLTTSSGGGDAQLKEILSSLKRKDATDATRQKYAIELRNYVRFLKQSHFSQLINKTHTFFSYCAKTC